MRVSERLARYVRASPRERRAKRHYGYQMIDRWSDPEYWRADNRRWRALVAKGQRFELVSRTETFLVRVGDSTIGRQVFLTGEYDFGKFRTALTLLESRHLGTLVDVGANIGTISIPAVARGIARSAIAIEPDPLNFSLLTMNVALNDLRNRIECHQVAAGPNFDSCLVLELDDENLGDHRISSTVGALRNRSDAVVVSSARLDDLAPSLDPKTDLLWMDVQGFELHALRGATRIIGSRVPLVMEFWPHGLAEHGGLDDAADILAPYEAFIDLSSPDRAVRPLKDLSCLYDVLGEGGAYTDLLLR